MTCRGLPLACRGRADGPCHGPWAGRATRAERTRARRQMRSSLSYTPTIERRPVTVAQPKSAPSEQLLSANLQTRNH
jgi:hypothetical protein